ncbi:MAG TPA: ATP-binding protein [Anaerolineales bacterium]
MAYHFRPNLVSLPVRMVLSFVALAVLTAAAVGLPAILLIRTQMDRQAWARADQGSSTAQALYAAQQSDLNNLAMLTAQRPTLINLVEQGDRPALQDYLHILLSGSELNAILICGPDGQVMAQSGQALPGQACQQDRPGSVYLEQPGAAPNPTAPHAWLLGVEPAPGGKVGPWKVIVGLALDRPFATRMRDLTGGLEQVLLVDGQLAASSFPEGSPAAEAVAHLGPVNGAPANGNIQRGSFTLGGAPYYATRFSLDGTRLESVVALPVLEIENSQWQLTRTILLSILGVAVLGSILAVWLAGRINRPLADLGQAALALKQGDLVTPVSVRTNISEVAIVAYTLEDARVALYHTLAELRREKDWIEHLLESIVEGIVTMDQHNRVTYFSHGAEQITGWKQEQVLGRYCDEVFHPAEANERFSRLMPAPGGRQKIVLTLRSGRQATLAITGGRLAPPEAGKARVVLVLRDVSDEEAVHRLLGDFLANIAHEFRTPLSALDASIELLLDQLPDLSQAELNGLLGSLHLGILGLQTLIDNLLEGASIETGRFRVSPRPVELGEMVDEATRLMQPLLEKYAQSLSVRLPEALPRVQADPRRTVQVLVNLISNAVKYGPQEAEISLEADPCEEGVKVMVIDRGPGIPPEHLPDLFRRFVHFGAGGDGPGFLGAKVGAGLGLSVVKAIVEAQGGRVGVSNRPEGGAVFWFTLPPAK